MTVWLRCMACILLVCLTGCGMPLTDEDMRATDEGRLLLKLAEELRTRDIETVISFMSDETKTMPDFRNSLTRVMGLLPADEQPSRIEFLQWSVNVSTDQGRTSTISAQLKYASSWAMLEAGFAGEGSDLRVQGFVLSVLPNLPDGASPFTIGNHTRAGTISLVSAVATVACAVAGVFMAVMTKGLRKKWLWAVLCAVGCSGIYHVPATGDIKINFLDFNPFDPAWYVPPAQGSLHLVFPVGAIIFLLMRRKLPVSAALQSPPEASGKA